MASEEDFEYDYEYSDDDENPDMDWDSQSGENPNAAPMAGASRSSVKAHQLLASPKSGIRMMPPDELAPVMKQRLKDVTEVLDIPASAAAVLLREHNWSKDDLTAEYFNDPDKILKKYGVYARCHEYHNNSSSSDPNNSKGGQQEQTCEICYDTTDKSNMLAMPCGHEFCKDCWFEFCTNAIGDGPVCVQTTCPHAGCKEVVTEEEMTISLTPAGTQLLSRFLNFQLRSFVESNSLTRWCPGKGCERIACATSASAMELDGNVASCDSCSTRFCLICGEGPHAPTTCKDLAQWNEKCRNESETANWILANTKSCPKCISRIEKNQGCNHMTCQRCKHEFCWICMGDWNDHGANTGGYYKCNKYDPNGGSLATGGEADQSDAARAKRELDRYLHYYKRYHAHSEAQEFAKKQLKETECRMIQLQESSNDAKWSDVEFLKTANEQLVECRRVLKYTYVFAYYLTGSSTPGANGTAPAGNSANANIDMQKQRFEHHQEMLERFTENLSELSEKPLAEMDRTNVVNQTRVVDRFMKNILKYVEDGMEDV